MPLHPLELIVNRFSDTAEVPNRLGPQAALSLACVQTPDNSARLWRITLGRVNRVDGQAIMNSQTPDLPVFNAPEYQYLAASRIPLPPPVIPPRRANPIWSTQAPNLGNIFLPIFVQIEWGMGDGQRFRMIANWPMCGGSILIGGSKVEVFGGTIIEQNNPPVPLGSFPKLNACITPDEGPVVTGGELSLTQNVLVVPVVPTASGTAGLQTSGAGIPSGPPGFSVPGLSPPQTSLPTSAVFGVAPFSSWAALIRPHGGAFGAGGNQGNLVIEATNAVRPPTFELRDNQIPDGLGGWVPSPGNTGIIYATNAGAVPHTVAELETLIDTTSVLFRVETPSPGQVNFLADRWTTLAGVFTPQAAGVGVGLVRGATGGGIVYVPDFARLVNVTVAAPHTAFIGENPSIPFSGPFAAQLVWYDDLGAVVFSEFQGVFQTAGAGIELIESQVWRRVPANAVMLGIFCQEGVTLLGQVHWRLSP